MSIFDVAVSLGIDHAGGDANGAGEECAALLPHPGRQLIVGRKGS
jgi:hypothetical protein